jgi:hypothetical protein
MFTATEGSQMCMGGGGDSQGYSFSSGSQGSGQTDSTRERGWLKKHTKEDGGKESTRNMNKETDNK